MNTGASPPAPNYVCVGHYCLDLTNSGHRLGGTVAYAGRAAMLLGARLGVYTSGDPQHRMLLQEVLPGAELCWVSSRSSTTFRNTYALDGARTQEILAVAAPLPPAGLPRTWAAAAVFHLGPLVGEVPLAMVDTLPAGALVGVTPQGWLRTLHVGGAVRKRRWDSYREVLARADVLVFSEEDVGDEAEALLYARAAKLAVITRADRGADLLHENRWTRFPAHRTNQVDPTGAGDVFAAAFLLEYRRTGSPAQACRFANSAASFVIESPGLCGMAREPEVRSRMALLPGPP